MQTMQELVRIGLKTATAGPSTKTWTSKITSEELVEAREALPLFQTCGDRVLEKAIVWASAFLARMKGQACPLWLTYIGNSGTGKTFLAGMLRDAARQIPHLSRHQSLLSPIRTYFWPKLLGRLRNGEFHLSDEIEDANFGFLDDLYVEHDPSGFATDKLYEILARRCGKWTVLTSNLSEERFKALDMRILSRIYRGDNGVLAVKTVDFSNR